MTSLLTRWWRSIFKTSSSHHADQPPWFENRLNWCRAFVLWDTAFKISFPRPPKWRHRSPGRSSSPSPAMFSVLSSAQLLSFLLAALGPGDCINIRGIGLNHYSRYWIASIFEVLDWINIRGIGLNQYFRYWIESIFQVLDWINIPSIGLNHISGIGLKIEPKILFANGLNAFLYV